MILSYHPCIVGHRNRLCAGRDPDAADREAITAAEAVILPQGCRPRLYQMARDHCANVFPNYTARIEFPGKSGQIRLFRQIGAPHPETRLCDGVSAARDRLSRLESADFPVVLKLDWGGEGHTVFFVSSPSTSGPALAALRSAERNGNGRCLIQSYVPCHHRTLRVAVIGDGHWAYWRVQPNTDRLHTNLAAGGQIDAVADPSAMSEGRSAVARFCTATGIDLAGFDLLFPERGGPPLFLEINYFFGRRGLGGSERFYRLLEDRLRHWLGRRGLHLPEPVMQGAAHGR